MVFEPENGRTFLGFVKTDAFEGAASVVEGVIYEGYLGGFAFDKCSVSPDVLAEVHFCNFLEIKFLIHLEIICGCFFWQEIMKKVNS